MPACTTTTLYDAAYGNGFLLTAALAASRTAGNKWGLLRYTMPDLVFSSMGCRLDRIGGMGFGGGNFLYISWGNCYRSIDGTQPVDCGPFPRLTTDTSYPLRFAYGMGNFVAVGTLTNAPRGSILTSSDGTGWGPNPPAFLTAGPLTDVAFLGGKFIALGDSDLLKSDDGGQTWGAFAGGTVGRGVAFNQGVYVVTQPNGTIQACYQPEPPGPPRILPASLGFTNGQFTFTLQSTSALRFEIQASTNLANWTNLATLTNVTGTISFIDSATNFKHRFYRAHQLP